jgi:hypothetical protein
MGVKRLDRESDRSSYWKCVKLSLFCLLFYASSSKMLSPRDKFVFSFYYTEDPPTSYTMTHVSVWPYIFHPCFYIPASSFINISAESLVVSE